MAVRLPVTEECAGSTPADPVFSRNYWSRLFDFYTELHESMVRIRDRSLDEEFLGPVQRLDAKK
jgi:hypothetical protein